jgi:hypothetical protein
MESRAVNFQDAAAEQASILPSAEDIMNLDDSPECACHHKVPAVVSEVRPAGRPCVEAATPVRIAIGQCHGMTSPGRVTCTRAVSTC